MRVDLPAPFSPHSAWISPAASVNDTSLSATTPGNRFVRARTSSRAAAIGGTAT
jgi:hypothetical protein